MSSSFRRATAKKKSIPNETTSTGNNHPFASSTPFTRYAQSSTSSPISSPSFTTKTVLERVGTKPSKGGLTLTSSGLRELDAILGGGQPLRTAILIEEDRWTQDLALSLVRYWAAEAASQEQNLSLVATAPDIHVDTSELSFISNTDIHKHVPIQQRGMNPAALQSFISLLPRNLHLDKARAKMTQMQDSPTITHDTATKNDDFTIIEEDEDFDEDDDPNTTNDETKDALLQNAWQYKLSIQKERRAQYSSSLKSSNKKEFCHSYDLSRRMVDQHPPNWSENHSKISIFDGSKCNGNGIHLYQQCLQHIMDIIDKHPNGVLRVLFLNTPTIPTSIALPLLLSHIRHHSLPVVCMLTVRPWILQPSSSQSIQALTSLRRTCDAVLTCEGFDAMVTPPPSEFSDLAGLLSIRKMALQAQNHFCDSTTTRRPPANRYGMKRDRRKVHIRMLHLPPEDFSKGGSSVGSGVRSGGGRIKEEGTTALQPGLGCASNLRKSSNAMSLDF